MGIVASILLYIVSIALIVCGICSLVNEEEGLAFISGVVGTFLFLFAHVPPSIGPYYIVEEPWDKYDYKNAVVETWYEVKETNDTVKAYIVGYNNHTDKYKLSDGHEMPAPIAIKNSGGIRIKQVMKQDNPYGNWAWFWERIKIGNGE